MAASQPHTFTRQELYELAWAEPMRTLAPRFGLSDSGLAKACRKAHIPLPVRGYWAKLKTGKKVTRRPLPARGPGMSDQVIVGGSTHTGTNVFNDKALLEMEPVRPVFDRPMAEIETEVRKRVGRVAVGRGLQKPHRAIARLLEADEVRRQKMAEEAFSYSWDQPLFEAPFEKRRFRILNAVFTKLSSLGYPCNISGRHGRGLSVMVHDQLVNFTLDDTAVSRAHYHHDYVPPSRPSGRMELCIPRYDAKSKGLAWSDDDAGKIERHLTEIVVQLVLGAEIDMRENAERHYEWRCARRTQLIEEARQAKEKAEREERERREAAEQAKVDRLLAEARALQNAETIRIYVARVQERAGKPDADFSAAEIDTWSAWALEQAARIDPVASGAFLTSFDAAADVN